jgi:hypothetical protein
MKRFSINATQGSIKDAHEDERGFWVPWHANLVMFPFAVNQTVYFMQDNKVDSAVVSEVHAVASSGRKPGFTVVTQDGDRFDSTQVFATKAALLGSL